MQLTSWTKVREPTFGFSNVAIESSLSEATKGRSVREVTSLEMIKEGQVRRGGLELGNDEYRAILWGLLL